MQIILIYLMKQPIKILFVTLSTLLCFGTAQAQDKVLNLYSARHYPTDEALYSDFTKATGIKINRVDSDDAGIIARLKAEGSASPADVIFVGRRCALVAWRSGRHVSAREIKSARGRCAFAIARQAGGRRWRRLVWFIHPSPRGGVRQTESEQTRCGHL